MAFFKPDKYMNIIVDASSKRMGVMLTQEGNIIYYASRALTVVEQCYSQTEREMFMAVYPVEYFQLYLFRSKFRITTDHKSFLGIFKSQKSATICIECQKLQLMSCKYELIYYPGGKKDYRLHQSAYTLAARKRETMQLKYMHVFSKILMLEEVETSTQQDAHLQKLMSAWGKDSDLSLSSSRMSYCR